ncbi:cytosolic protein [Sutcliffiella halmapala]|uniref:cytosolic protein n=1 Tax=Sutcliffiella halmapala TaxID=79882 RepID=UPI0009958E4E|nr:cytosolic protein [Sutcliffiella halmapala]
MGAIQKLKTILSTHTETRENHFDEELRSHYYKVTNKNAIKALQEMFQKLNGYTVKSISEEHGEIAVHVNKGKKAFMVVTVISVRPFETAIDFSVTTDTAILPFDFGYSRKLILQTYKELNKTLTYIGSGLNSER